MRAAYIDKPDSIIYTDVPEPQITKDNEVKIRVKVTGICGSEVHAFHGKHMYRIPPVVSGHEFAGEIIETGRKVSKYRIGDRVTVEPHYGCGKCIYCKAGKYNICKNKVILGSNSWSGSFGEFVVALEEAVISIPDNMSFEQAALIEPLAVGLHLVRRSGLKAGQSVAIIGAGTIGLSILVSAKLAGAEKIIISDVVDYNLEMAKKLGATHYINSAKEDTANAIKKYCETKGIDIVYVAVEAVAAFQTALTIAPGNGLIATVVTPSSGCDMSNVIQKELRIVGSLMYVHEEFEIVRDRIVDGRIDVQPFISVIIPIEKVSKAMEIADKRTENVIKVMLSF